MAPSSVGKSLAKIESITGGDNSIYEIISPLGCGRRRSVIIPFGVFAGGVKISRRSDKRREPRHKLNTPAWIDVGGGASVQRCTVVDISSGGARLELADIQAIPDTFSLLLSKFGQPRYQCNVVWKAATAVGVEFTKPAPAATDQCEHADQLQPVQSGSYAHTFLGEPSADEATILDQKNLQRAPGRIEPVLAYTTAHGLVMGLLRRLSEKLGRQIFTA